MSHLGCTAHKKHVYVNPASGVVHHRNVTFGETAMCTSMLFKHGGDVVIHYGELMRIVTHRERIKIGHTPPPPQSPSPTSATTRRGRRRRRS